ncbi:MAG: fatty acid desaturase [Chroococcidiopsidaceae cyanobacterium CP_BM_ER_R8_30]|nr:fatty acid desaturase [Chroococcidiopsidaceae cyanobacterium CP_BM_ER_R8_30]
MAVLKDKDTLLDSGLGILSTFMIFIMWLGSFVILSYVNVAKLPVILVLMAVFGRTFLHTGLFIVAHDAAHGAILPYRKINHLIGALAITFYALLSYKKFVENHWKHHIYVASPDDPDFHNGKHKNPIAWYVRFMLGYLDWKQNLALTVLMTIIFHSLRLGLHIPGMNLVLFWALPSLLSSIQLFYFGTFLPHRQPKEGYTNIHCAKSSYFPCVWSFFTCYHFGYHWEHHEYPHIPWFKLPSARKLPQQV